MNVEDAKQLMRSSSSVGANYIEANKKPGDKDFKLRLKIVGKEAKDRRYWLRLLRETNDKNKENIDDLINEAQELRKILSATIDKSK